VIETKIIGTLHHISYFDELKEILYENNIQKIKKIGIEISSHDFKKLDEKGKFFHNPELRMQNYVLFLKTVSSKFRDYDNENLSMMIESYFKNKKSENKKNFYFDEIGISEYNFELYDFLETKNIEIIQLGNKFYDEYVNFLNGHQNKNLFSLYNFKFSLNFLKVNYYMAKTIYDYNIPLAIVGGLHAKEINNFLKDYFKVKSNFEITDSANELIKLLQKDFPLFNPIRKISKKNSSSAKNY